MSLTAAALFAVTGGVLGWWPLAGWAMWVSHSAAGSAAGPAAGSAAESDAESGMQVRTVRGLCAASAALSCGFIAWSFWPEWVLPALLAFCAVAVVLSAVDLVENRLPNTVIVVGIVAVALLLVVAAVFTGEWMRLLGAVAWAAGVFAAFLVLALISPAAMGMGDVKLAALIGLVLGWFGVWAVLVGVLASFVIGGLVAIGALALRRVTLRGTPFWAVDACCCDLGPGVLFFVKAAMMAVAPEGSTARP